MRTAILRVVLHGGTFKGLHFHSCPLATCGRSGGDVHILSCVREER